MDAKRDPEPTRSVRLPDGTYADAPDDRTCAACESPLVTEIDDRLIRGVSAEAIHAELVASMKRTGGSRCPSTEVVRAHIAHLPESVREPRLQAEEWLLVLREHQVHLAIRLAQNLSAPWEDALLALWEAARQFIPADQYEAFLGAWRKQREFSAAVSRRGLRPRGL